MQRIILLLYFITINLFCICQEKSSLFTDEYIKETINKVAYWQINHPKHHPRDWTNAVLYTGLYASWEATQLQYIYDYLINVGEKANWEPYTRWYHADDIAISQTYIDLYRIENRLDMLNPTIDTLYKFINLPYPQKRPHETIKWWWCDALFMASPVLVKLGVSTNNNKYLQLNDKYFKETYDLLYDKSEKLFYRDANYFNRRESNGEKIFWSRGNGWVISSLAKILAELPHNYTQRHFYEHLFKEMAERIVGLQSKDGLWRSSLLNPQSYSYGEVSGTGLFCYALAWGINNHLLDRDKFLTPIQKAWIALNKCVDKDGKVGWVQPIGSNPDKNFNENSWEVYGTAAFLLAASQIIQMNINNSK